MAQDSHGFHYSALGIKAAERGAAGISMDTDELSEMAYDMIVQAARISDTLKAELGALSGNYDKEDDWLRGILGHFRKISADPEAYVDYWNLEAEEGVTPGVIGKSASELCKQVDEVLSRPLNKRGKIE